MNFASIVGRHCESMSARPVTATGTMIIDAMTTQSALVPLGQRRSTTALPRLSRCTRRSKARAHNLTATTDTAAPSGWDTGRLVAQERNRHIGEFKPAFVRAASGAPDEPLLFLYRFLQGPGDRHDVEDRRLLDRHGIRRRLARLTGCASAASGHAAAPPSSVMNSRRRIAIPRVNRASRQREAWETVGHRCLVPLRL